MQANNQKSSEWKSTNRRYQSKKLVSDDGYQSFFWRAHTVTVLVVLMAVLVYVALFEQQVNDQSYNIKR